MLPFDASDAQILAELDHWAELLAQGRLGAGLDLIDTSLPLDYLKPWSRQGIETAIASGGLSRAPGRTFALASSATERRLEHSRWITRWSDPEHGRHESDPEYTNPIGSVVYELPLDGYWCTGVPAARWNVRLAASFLLRVVADHLVLELISLEPTFLDWSQLQSLIADQCRRPGPSWLPHLTNDDPTIWAVCPLDDGAFFRSRVLFTASVRGTFLAHRYHPYGGSFGNFAFDGVNLQYLDHRPYEALTELLRTEGRSLDEGDPVRLAKVAATVLALGGVAQTVDDTGRLCGAELRRFSRLMKPPTIAGDRQSGWSLRFWSMWYDGPQGCMMDSDLYTADARYLRVSSSFAVHRCRRVSHRTVRRFLRRVVSRIDWIRQMSGGRVRYA